MILNKKLKESIDELNQKEEIEKERVKIEEDKRLNKIYQANLKKEIESNLDEIPLADQLSKEDNLFDPTNLKSCLQHIFRLQTEKRSIANDYERYQNVFKTDDLDPEKIKKTTINQKYDNRIEILEN